MSDDLALIGTYWHDNSCLYYVTRRAEGTLWIENCRTLAEKPVTREELEELHPLEPKPETVVPVPG